MSRRVRYFDGLRALAVLSVVAFHAGKYSRADLTRVFPRIVMQGHHGVELFFVISGLCLSYPVLLAVHDRASTPFDVIGYAAKRLIRIVPPFYAAIALFAAIGPQRVPIGDVVRQALFIDNGTQLLNSSFWSLPVEFRWYALFPLLLALWVRSARTFVWLIAVLFVLEQTRAQSTDLVALPAFMLGIIAADFAVRPRELGRLALPLFAVVGLAAFLHASPLDSGQETSVLWELCAFLLVVAAGATPWLKRALSSGPLAFVGVASYSTYLCHELAVHYAEQAGYAPVLAGIGGILLGIAFWYVVERPFTGARVRERLTAPLTGILRRAFRIAGIPAGIDLVAKQIPSRVDSERLETFLLQDVRAAQR
ncbi:MAG TPA: acyltransferase [Candidatus Baltobacteraceae bacterium]|nr:acyltransferase [Candidatus Baltobacteraceae bacterium]